MNIKNQEVTITDFTGFITIGDDRIPCAVLYPESENPIRVIVQREIVGLLTGNKKGGFERYLKPTNLQKYLPKKFISKDLSSSTHLFKKSTSSRIAQGFEGPDLIDFCQMYMQARTDGVLLPNQMQLAIQAEIIVFAFAKTGIIGVIDNVTGYEKLRPRFALNRLLEKYIVEEARKWVKRFPDKFYQLIFKLNRWSYDEETIKKRPSIIGKWTNQIIYARFPKGVLSRLQDKNPIIEKGRRKIQHHRLLTDIGNDELKEYISNAIFLMESSANWNTFQRALKRATGQPYDGDLFEDQ